MTKQEDEFAKSLPAVLKFIWMIIRWHKVELLIFLVLLFGSLTVIMIKNPEVARYIGEWISK